MAMLQWTKGMGVLVLVLATACTGAPDAGGDAGDGPRLADRDAIGATLDRYIRGLDRLDSETYLSAWAADGEVSLYGDEVHRGHEALAQYIVHEKAERAAAEERGEGFVQFHQLYNQRVEFTGAETAEHRAYWTASRRRPDGSIHVAFIGRLVDEFRLRDGKWLLQRREVLSDP